MDTPLLLLRPDLRAAEEALRRWLNVVALVRSGSDGGSVIAVGESSGRALQALVRVDPAGFAARELAERRDAHFPPAAALLVVDGRQQGLDEFVSLARLPEHTELLGPVDLPRRARQRCRPAAAGPFGHRGRPRPNWLGPRRRSLDPQCPQERRRPPGHRGTR